MSVGMGSLPPHPLFPLPKENPHQRNPFILFHRNGQLYSCKGKPGCRAEHGWGCLCLEGCAEKGAFNAKHTCFQLLSGASPVAVTWPDKAWLKYRQCGFKAVRKRTRMLFRKFFRHGQGLGCNSTAGKSDRGSSWAQARPRAALKAVLHLPPGLQHPFGSSSAHRGRGKGCVAPSRCGRADYLLFFCARAKRLLAFLLFRGEKKVKNGKSWHVCEGVGVVWGWVVVSG